MAHRGVKIALGVGGAFLSGAFKPPPGRARGTRGRARGTGAGKLPWGGPLYEWLLRLCFGVMPRIFL